MTIKRLTTEQHQKVAERLLTIARSITGTRYHQAGPKYTSLMVCFLLHNVSAVESLLKLVNTYGNQWFPTTIGYVITRTMFETEITAHYIAQDPRNRSRQYIDFECVLNKREMDTCFKYRDSNNSQWREAMDMLWENVWKPKQDDINHKYQSIRSNFEHREKNGKRSQYRNWAGKSLREIAVEVNHQEAYEIFYAELSSFAHVDVCLANRFLRIRPDGLSWTQEPKEFDIGNVFRYASIFFTCFMELFASQFDVWSKEQVRACWDFEKP